MKQFEFENHQIRVDSFRMINLPDVSKAFDQPWSQAIKLLDDEFVVATEEVLCKRVTPPYRFHGESVWAHPLIAWKFAELMDFRKGISFYMKIM